MKSIAPKKKAFSRFKVDEAFKQLKLTQLTPWKIDITPIAPTAEFQNHLDRLQFFDLERSEEGKKLLIDAILIEAIQPFKQLKFWKGANLESEVAHGAADYLMTEQRRYFEAPFVCVVEAKKDDFEQGLAQCLMEMEACQWSNRKVNRDLDIFGIVTNGEGWKFYKLTLAGTVYETLLYSISSLDSILGLLRFVFQQCQQNLGFNN
jgi:hypothetical protein